MKTREEIKKWLLENCVDKYENLDLSGLDFSDFDGDVFLSYMKVKNNLYQGFQKVNGILVQSHQEVKGGLLQENQEVDGDLDQSEQIVKGSLIQDFNTVGGDLYQSYQEVEGTIEQYGHEAKEGVFNDYERYEENKKLQQSFDEVIGNLNKIIEKLKKQKQKLIKKGD